MRKRYAIGLPVALVASLAIPVVVAIDQQLKQSVEEPELTVDPAVLAYLFGLLGLAAGFVGSLVGGCWSHVGASKALAGSLLTAISFSVLIYLLTTGVGSRSETASFVLASVILGTGSSWTGEAAWRRAEKDSGVEGLETPLTEGAPSDSRWAMRTAGILATAIAVQWVYRRQSRRR